VLTLCDQAVRACRNSVRPNFFADPHQSLDVVEVYRMENSALATRFQTYVARHDASQIKACRSSDRWIRGSVV
jgi:hypothetical protein